MIFINLFIGWIRIFFKVNWCSDCKAKNKSSRVCLNFANKGKHCIVNFYFSDAVNLYPIVVNGGYFQTCFSDNFLLFERFDFKLLTKWYVKVNFKNMALSFLQRKTFQSVLITVHLLVQSSSK